MPMQDVRYDQYFTEVMRVMTSRGLLLTSRSRDGRANSMIIGWGLIGSIWGLPVWTVLVRPSRYTYELIEQTGDFTISVPGPGMEKACQICGSSSGRGRDKLALAGLKAAPARKVSSPVIEGCIVQYECRVLHKSDLQPGTLVQSILTGSYPNGDFHRTYWGEIVAAYADTDRLSELRA
jgi:flavin reductase (DIM6/NTAB) family NADH-FMN oxidoreductase RutF